MSSFTSAARLALKFYGEMGAEDEAAKLAEMQIMQTIESASNIDETVEGARNETGNTLSQEQIAEISVFQEVVQAYRTALILNFGQLISEFNAQNITQFDRPLNYLDEPEQQEDDLLVPDFNYVNETLAA